MIIKGNPAGSVKFWSAHLLRDDTNERAEVKEISGLLAEDLPSALREMEAIADQSRCHGNFMYQANINPREDEHLTPEQWKEAIDTLEKNLGLEGHQRIVIEHVKHGREHCHVVWNRVDVDTLKVADIGGNWHTHMETARELEARFDLTPTPTPDRDNTDARKSAAELYEIRAAERSGIDPAALKAELTELWSNTRTGAEFVAAVEERGYMIAKGDRRDFCLIDQAGDAHSLARRLDGVTAHQVRERMGDVDRDSLPSVAEARSAQRGCDPVQEYGAQESVPERNAGIDSQRAAGDESFRDQRWEAKVEAENARIDPVDVRGAVEGSALLVSDTAGRFAGKLADFVGNLLAGASPRPKSDEFTQVGQMEQFQANRRAIAALENIRDSIERGKNLSASDLANLTPAHLENIRLKGDDYLRSIIESNERNRPREMDWGRFKER